MEAATHIICEPLCLHLNFALTMAPLPSRSLLLLVLLLLAVSLEVRAFTVVRNPLLKQSSPSFSQRQRYAKAHSTTTTQLRASTTPSPSSVDSAVEVKYPNQDEAVALGAREWPPQVRSGKWTDRLEVGAIAARYVLDGRGTIDVTLFDAKTGLPKTSEPTRHNLVPGSLVEAMGPATIEWTSTTPEMIVLSPKFEQAGLLAGVATAIVLLFAALLSGVGQ